MNEQDRALDQVEAAQFLGVGPRTLEAWRLARRGPKFIAYSKRCVRYKLSDLLAYQERYTVATGAAEQGKAARG